MLLDPLAQSAPVAILKSELLSQVPGVVHGITSRVGGMGLAHGNVAYSPPRDQQDAWSMRGAWCASLGLDPESIVTAGQVHGAAATVVEPEQSGIGARPGTGRVALCDALLTRYAGPVLLTLHADCLPIILVDPDLPAVASVHAGWRGTVVDVAGSAVRTMSAEFGSDPTRMMAFLGPSICQKCYEVGEEVAIAWGSIAGERTELALDTSASRYHFDLKEANRLQLLLAGLSPAHIDTSPICTKCQGDAWFSHRGQGPETGRFGAIVSISAD
jgi:polyphenol oxidase